MRLACLLVVFSLLACAKPQGAPDKVNAAQAIDAVSIAIMAHRRTYETLVVERLSQAGAMQVSPDYDAEPKHLPLPVQFLERAGSDVAHSPEGDRLKFRLISLDAINTSNLPTSEFEKEGMAKLAKKPDVPVRGIFFEKGRTYYQSLYADKAVSMGCVECHNAHPRSPRADYQMGDVMGALWVAIAIDEKQ
ncbi:MAG: DUF3365 domain-containing protein [Myxococcaceae bacterium]|nr:DUF3365 domain-containing protein [Myxococcaceae bacterium]